MLFAILDFKNRVYWVIRPPDILFHPLKNKIEHLES